jgi:hypothetical protein
VTTAGTKPNAQKLCLLQSLRGEWLKLPLAVMRDCGPAAQTLAGLMRITNKETFASVSTIATRARLPLWTCRKHLVTLDAKGYISNDGRGRTRRGAPRRTCTIRIAGRTKAAIQAGYGVLPWWACCLPRSGGRLPWSSKAVLSVIMARLMSMVSIVEEQDGRGNLHADEPWDSISNLGDADRFRFSLDSLERDTGLSRPAIVGAKRELKDRKIINWYRDQRLDGGDGTDVLIPSETFRVVVTPASEGRCYVEF